MIDVPFSPDEKPLTWKLLNILNSGIQILLTCPESHPVFLQGHKVLDDGTVTAVGKSPSVVCDFAIQGCKFHDQIRLLNWQQYKPTTEEFTAGVWRNL